MTCKFLRSERRAARSYIALRFNLDKTRLHLFVFFLNFQLKCLEGPLKDSGFVFTYVWCLNQILFFIF